MTKTEIATGKKWEYTWDYRNRLTNVKEKNASGQILKESNFTYDPFDKLIIRSNDPDGPGPQPATVTKTVYDGVHPYADFNGSNSLTDRYLYGPAVDMILANLEPDGDLFWYLTDHLGTVRDIANKFGSVVDHVKYASFGHVISESQPANGDRFKFTARELESALDDYFYRARWYDDDVGRFVSEDPTGFEAGDPNFYRYVRNAPTALVDPLGNEGTGPSIWGTPAMYGFNTWQEYSDWQLSTFGPGPSYVPPLPPLPPTPTRIQALSYIRLYRPQMRDALGQQLMSMLQAYPPDPAVTGHPTTPQDWYFASSILAHQYIDAVEDFLETHHGAEPALGTYDRWSDDEYSAPNCNHWALCVNECLYEATCDPRVNSVFRYKYGQYVRPRKLFQQWQQNFILVYPAGHPPQPGPYTGPQPPPYLILDPWWDILPRAYPPTTIPFKYPTHIDDIIIEK
jgi:RHS repeat-associated protein